MAASEANEIPHLSFKTFPLSIQSCAGRIKVIPGECNADVTARVSAYFLGIGGGIVKSTPWLAEQAADQPSPSYYGHRFPRELSLTSAGFITVLSQFRDAEGKSASIIVRA